MMKKMYMICSVSLFLGIFTARSAQADVFDDLTDTSNLVTFSNGITDSTILDDNSGSGILSVSRTGFTDDTGFDWRPSGTGYFSLALEDTFVVTPEITGTNNVGGYTVNFIFYTDTNDFIAETSAIPSTSSTGIQNIDVSAAAVPYPTAGQWFARFRLVDNATPEFEFDSLAAIPEPSTGMLVGLALGAFILLRRRISH